MAGNGTIGLELAEDLDDFDAVVIPWGGGGLTTGIASALAALRPETRIVVVEPETGAPVAAAVANGGVPVPVEYTPSFIDGAGSGGLLPDMWERAEPLVSDAFAIPLAEAADAVRLLAERARIVAEGAAGLAVAAALAGHAGTGASSASSAAGISIPPLSRRSSTAACPTDDSPSVRAADLCEAPRMHWQLAAPALILLGFAAISGRIEGTWITRPMVFTAAGLLVGIEALDIVDPAATLPNQDVILTTVFVTVGLSVLA